MVLITKHRLPPQSHLGICSPTKSTVVRPRGSLSRPHDEVLLRLASPKAIRRWATTRFFTGLTIGAITSADTIHYRTLKPVFGGLFCERIFGPVTDWECHCGRVRYGRAPDIDQWCPKCIVQITRSRCRRARFAYIPLGTPVFHMWYERNDRATNPLRRLLWLTKRDIDEVMDAQCMLVASGTIVTPATPSAHFYSLRAWDRVLKIFHVDRRRRAADRYAPWKPTSWNTINFKRFQYISNMSSIGLCSMLERRGMDSYARRFTHHLRILRTNKDMAERGHWLAWIRKRRLADSKLLKDLRKEFRHDLDELFEHRQVLVSALVFARNCFMAHMRPEWVFIHDMPVLPPTLRPILQLENGTLAISDINELYRLVIFRALRLRKLILLDVPEIILFQEVRLVQEAVSAVFDNGHLRYPVKRTVMFEVKESLQSIADRVVGKYGRFRQNLLGKRVDYSGRSVIIVGPTLRLWECGLPREMALELFYPILLNRLIRSGVVRTLRTAKRFMELYPYSTLKILHRTVALHPLVLNRAPTLHRMGMQAFVPRVIPGRAIQLHPFVCPAFNADFDGDQMAVHVPLCPEAIVEARLLLFAPLNWVSPATGDPSLLPSQDIILGIYYLTLAHRMPIPSTSAEARVHSPVWIRTPTSIPIGTDAQPMISFVSRAGQGVLVYTSSLSISDTFGRQRHTSFVTTVGRQLFHSYLPHAPAFNDILPFYSPPLC